MYTDEKRLIIPRLFILNWTLVTKSDLSSGTDAENNTVSFQLFLKYAYYLKLAKIGSNPAEYINFNYKIKHIIIDGEL